VPSTKRFIRPSASQESALQESHEGGRFHTARVRLGHSAMSAQMSDLPESGHGWTIYEYTP
jgi:hypothetical protein